MSATDRRYVIIGAGAIGALLAARLSALGRRVALIARGANLATIAEHGVIVHTPAGQWRARPEVATEPRQVALSADDVLLLATKTQDAERALAQWAWQPVCPPTVDGSALATDLPIVTFQNGLAAEALALRRFRRVYGASIGISASYLNPGEIGLRPPNTTGVVQLGRYPAGEDTFSAELVADLAAAGYRARAVGDIRAWKARKLLGNLGNALDLFALEEADAVRILDAVRAEARQAFSAAGIAVSPEPRATGLVVGGRRSTWQSYSRGSSSEVDYLNGEIVWLGREFGVDTPINEALQRVLGALALSRHNGRLAAIVDLPLQDPAPILARLMNPSGPTRWPLNPQPEGHRMTTQDTASLPTVPTIAPGIAHAAVDGGALLIDVRSKGARDRDGELPEATTVDRTRLAELFGTGSAERLAGVSGPDQPIVVICGSLHGSSPVAEELIGLGYVNVVQVDGAFPAWRDAGLPVADPVGEAPADA
ncbi:MAG: 2-dehydropantoate 2-reductase [Mycobacterium sp.]|nr:2-dehydropantoate 2-reductase [Mycobacterium sp.]